MFSASENSSNWFHTCLYHIINEPTRRKTAVQPPTDWNVWPRTEEGGKGKRNVLLPEEQERPDLLLRFYFQGFVTVTPLTFLQCCGSVKAFCLLFFFVVVFTPHFFQSPSAAVTIILCIWEDFLPVPQPDTAISLGQIAPSCKVFITGHSQHVTVPNPLHIDWKKNRLALFRGPKLHLYFKKDRYLLSIFITDQMHVDAIRFSV